MPVEIKELVIRAVVESDGDSDSEEAGPDDRAAVVRAAVKEVLRILRAAKER